MLSWSQFAYPYGVPQWGRKMMDETSTEKFSLPTQRPQLVTSGSHGRAGPPPTDRATAGGW